jgi:hypothetical protein
VPAARSGCVLRPPPSDPDARCQRRARHGPRHRRTSRVHTQDLAAARQAALVPAARHRHGRRDPDPPPSGHFVRLERLVAERWPGRDPQNKIKQALTHRDQHKAKTEVKPVQSRDTRGFRHTSSKSGSSSTNRSSKGPQPIERTYFASLFEIGTIHAITMALPDSSRVANESGK